MKIVGCDLHTRYQQVAMLDAETGELLERRLEQESGTQFVYDFGEVGHRPRLIAMMVPQR